MLWTTVSVRAVGMEGATWRLPCVLACDARLGRRAVSRVDRDACAACWPRHRRLAIDGDGACRSRNEHRVFCVGSRGE